MMRFAIKDIEILCISAIHAGKWIGCYNTNTTAWQEQPHARRHHFKVCTYIISFLPTFCIRLLRFANGRMRQTFRL